ncbi:MAG: helix-turn-helix domain-containing protein [Candidatus Micrarchaeota archaeon]|nr:helix-turn-helix domain-containing protein [Candidatus Micrarchaeota archaeon]
MPRGKRIVIEKVIKDPMIVKLKSMKISDMKAKRAEVEKELHENIQEIVNKAKELHAQDKLEKDRLKNLGLYTIDEAYDELRRGGIDISFRAFGGRVERKSIYSEKIGNKRVIPKPVINDWIALANEFYTVKQAYNELKKYEKLNLRAFIGRIEKNAIPSLKIGTQRWIPKAAIEGLIHIAKNYYDVSQAMEVLAQRGIKIKRNAFERRLDRNRIPHEKIGGRRIIAKEVLEELITKELALARTQGEGVK